MVTIVSFLPLGQGVLGSSEARTYVRQIRFIASAACLRQFALHPSGSDALNAP
jgi:hypothetical protein